MNFLAHLHLSAGTSGSMTGGIAADLVRPAEVAALPADIRDGVMLHRQVDAFTDRHPVVRRSVGRLPGHGWFGGILVDVYYDHLLARGWDRYSPAEPLRAFADRAYSALASRLDDLPAPAVELFHRLIRDDRLVSYATVDGIAATLARVSDRIAARIPKHAVRLEQALPDLLAADAGLEADFHEFYPELIAFAGQYYDGGSGGLRPPAGVPLV